MPFWSITPTRFIYKPGPQNKLDTPYGYRYFFGGPLHGNYFDCEKKLDTIWLACKIKNGVYYFTENCVSGEYYLSWREDQKTTEATIDREE